VAVVGLDHVQLAMPKGGENLARGFYAGALGLVERTKPAHLAAHGGCWFEGGGVRLHLGVEPAFRPAKKAHVALLVDDLEATVKDLAARGTEFATGQPLDGYLRGDVHDPFGNRLELMQRV
jgi:catechol 2,3-dioxygenase-like lactoylglutathione lyase family enzyme